MLFFTTLLFGQSNQVVIDYFNNTKEAISLDNSKILVVKLPETPSTGYMWEVKSMDSKVLTKDDNYYFISENKSNAIGAEGTRIIKFKGESAGTTTLKLVCLRPWERGGETIYSASYQIKSQGKYKGNVSFKKKQYVAKPLSKNDYEVKSLPSHFNWQENNGTSSVKDQGQCGGCWSFAASAVFEGAIKHADNVERDLSEEFLISCNSDGWGCSGGMCPFAYFKDKVVSGDNQAGAVYESDFPYQAADASCNAPYTHHEKVDDWGYVGSSYSTPSITELKQAIYDHGSVWVGVYADYSFQSYTGGVFQGSSNSQPNHAVVLVGWDDNNQCWYMKNSWSPSWGESGYMRIKYGVNSIGYGAAYVDYTGSGTVDNEAPSQPQNLNYSNATSSAVNLSWTASTDNVGVTGYDIYQNNSFVKTVSTTSTTISSLSAATTYQFYVKAKDAAGNISAASNTISVTTGNVDGYCTSKGNSTNYEWIDKIVVGSLTNNSGKDNGYGDYTSKSVTLSPNQNVAVTLTPGFASSSYSEYWEVWIDYNNDGDFTDAGEQVYGNSGTSAVSGNFTVSSSASGTTRMRISMRYNTAPSSCGDFDYGEVEDYTVNFSGQVNPPSTPTNLSTNNVSQTGFTVNWNESQNATSYDLRVREAGGTWTNYTSISNNWYNVTGCTAKTTYEYEVRANNSDGSSSYSAIKSVTTLDNVVNDYCTSGGQNCSYEWIDLVQIGSINNTTSADGGYGDYTNLSTNVAVGSTVRLYISAGFASSSYTEYWSVWIDFNGNGTFDASEKVISGSSSSSDKLYADITIPSDAKLGQTRMRVSMKYGSASDPCGDFNYGEVEDYTVNIGTSTVLTSISDGMKLSDCINSEPILVYPDPVNNIINVSVNEGNANTIKIYNMQGKLVKSVIVNENDNRFNVSDLGSGCYIVNVTTERTNYTKMFIKK